MELDALRIDHAGLDQAASDLRRVVDRIDARLRDLERDLAPLQSHWLGDAQVAYTTARQRWSVAIGEMRDLLAITAAQVSQSNAEYRAADARGARAFDL